MGLERWRKRRGEFRTILEKSRATLKALAEAHEMAARLPSLSRAETEAGKAVGVCKDTEARAMATVEEARVCLAQAQARVTTAEERLAEHDRMKPSFFARLFIVRGARDWSSAHRPLVAARAEASKIFTTAELSVSASEKAYREAVAKRQVAERHRAEVAELHAIARRQVASVRERVGAHFVDAAFFAREHGEKHVSTPWLDVAAQRIRDDVFIAAMKLHKAFVDAAAKPLRHNLGVLMSVFSGRSPPQLISDVWASFFLVVPLVSTTFASVERTLGALPPESLGWLLVDEAGQALPQTAVGALMRTRRAVVVGDPIQIEPVVVLPDTLTQAICRQFGIDPDRFNAPDASVQTLADAATPYVAEFQGRYGSRTVGVPLLVHRRCAEPMFGISNAVAYNGLMVNAKAAKPSRIRDIIGPSAWIDVQGSAQDKWCPQEGGAAMALLRRLAATDVGAPDLYIVTPFVIVADNLRRLVSESRVLGGWTDDPWGWTHERIGTVHTVQGREAEAVIFVLGAPAPQQDGARRWAGGRPNLLNVAVTRAKEALYVIGNRRLWREAGLFRELDARLP